MSDSEARPPVVLTLPEPIRLGGAPARPTGAGQIFARMVREGWPGVENWVALARQESLHLDFKEANRPKRPGTDRSDRHQFSKALSGFANADGGVLVFGVAAKAGPERDDLDCVRAIHEICPLSVFRSELEGLIPEMVQGMVQGVEFASLEKPGESDTGVLLILIPASDRTPHMATGPDLGIYVRRDARSFRTMSHDEVTDAFGRRPQPSLRWRHETEMYIAGRGPRALSTPHLRIRFYVKNQGGAIAKFACLTLAPVTGWLGDRSPGNFESRPSPVLAGHRFALGADAVLYPDDEFLAATVTYTVSEVAPDGAPLPFSVRVTATCEDAAPHTDFVSLSVREVDAMAQDVSRRTGGPGYLWKP